MDLDVYSPFNVSRLAFERFIGFNQEVSAVDECGMAFGIHSFSVRRLGK